MRKGILLWGDFVVITQHHKAFDVKACTVLTCKFHFHTPPFSQSIYNPLLIGNE